MRVARACVAVLPAAGAGVSALANPDLRLPIGASDDTSCYVERLQFTYGDGPCLRAYRTGAPASYRASEIERIWPEFHRDLVSLTSFRSIASFPLVGEDGRLGAMDVYLQRSDGLANSDVETGKTLAHCASRALLGTGIFSVLAQRTDASGVDLASPADALVGRIQVWRAMGLLNVQLQMTAADALALLRAHAYSTDRLVDELAHDIVQGRVALDALRP